MKRMIRKELTAGDLKKALARLSDDTEVRILDNSDSKDSKLLVLIESQFEDQQPYHAVLNSVTLYAKEAWDSNPRTLSSHKSSTQPGGGWIGSSYN